MRFNFKRFAAVALAAILIQASTSAASADDSGQFAIRQLRTEAGARESVRFNIKTGESWYNWTTWAPKWVKIDENGPVPIGDYDVLLLAGSDKDTAWGLRFDKVSGKTWNFGQKGWEEFSEPAPAPATAAPAK